MAYPTIKHNNQTFELTPQLLVDIGHQVAPQIKAMSFQEMWQLGQAAKVLLNESGLGQMLKFFGGGAGGE